MWELLTPMVWGKLSCTEQLRILQAEACSVWRNVKEKPKGVFISFMLPSLHLTSPNLTWPHLSWPCFIWNEWLNRHSSPWLTSVTAHSVHMKLGQLILSQMRWGEWYERSLTQKQTAYLGGHARYRGHVIASLQEQFTEMIQTQAGQPGIEHVSILYRQIHSSTE